MGVAVAKALRASPGASRVFCWATLSAAGEHEAKKLQDAEDEKAIAAWNKLRKKQSEREKRRKAEAKAQRKSFLPW